VTYHFDLNALISTALDEPELKRVLENPQTGASATFIRNRLREREEDIRSQASKAFGEYDQANLELVNKRAQLEQAIAAPWFFTVFGFALILAGLTLAGWGAATVFGYSTLQDLRAWFLASKLAPVLPTGWVVLGTAAAALIIASGLWWFRTRPQRETQVSLDLDLVGTRKRLEQADEAAKQTVLRIVREEILQLVNLANDDFFQFDLVVGSTPAPGLRETTASGLSEVVNSDNEAPTEMRASIIKLIEELPGASIGISGPRGAGKSTLLASLCAANPRIAGKEAIAIYTASPVEYDAREFLLHLFSTLCRQILKTKGLGDDRVFDIDADLDGRSDAMSVAGLSQNSVSKILMLLGLVLSTIGISLASLISRFPLNPARAVDVSSETAAPSIWKTIDFKPGPLILWGVVCLAIGMVFYFLGAIRTPITVSTAGRARPRGLIESLFFPRRRYIHPDRLVNESIRNLRDIQFQRSYTTGWSGSLKVPPGFDLGSNKSLSLSQRPESLPELVERFRRYVSSIVATKEHARVIVGIDELDKLKSAASAESFLNEIKSVFNIPGCYYLISVSENALSNFERRGLPLRDAFDSAFDDIRYINYLTLEGSRSVLIRRVLNLPGPFLCLCHVLSGGLPRDLIRVTRAILSLARESGPQIGLAELSRKILRAEAVRKARAASIVVREIPSEFGQTKLLTEIAALEQKLDLPAFPNIAATDDQSLDNDAEDDGVTKVLASVRREIHVYMRFLDLVETVFGGMTTEQSWRNVRTAGLIDRLTLTRQSLEVGLGIAESHLDAVCELVRTSHS